MSGPRTTTCRRSPTASRTTTPAAVKTAGRWLGTAATGLGLSLADPVVGDDLRAVLAGLQPGTGQSPNGGPPTVFKGRVPGFDLTFAAPKSVSVLYALGDPLVESVVVAAHDRAVDAALAWLEREACFVRRGSNNRASRERRVGRLRHPPPAGCRVRRRRVPASHQPRRRPASAHPCAGRQHHPRPRRALVGARRPGPVSGQAHRRRRVPHRPGPRAHRAARRRLATRRQGPDRDRRRPRRGPVDVLEATLGDRSRDGPRRHPRRRRGRRRDARRPAPPRPRSTRPRCATSGPPRPPRSGSTPPRSTPCSPAGTRSPTTPALVVRLPDPVTGEVVERQVRSGEFAAWVGERMADVDSTCTRHQILEIVATYLPAGVSPAALEDATRWVLAQPELIPIPRPSRRIRRGGRVGATLDQPPPPDHRNRDHRGHRRPHPGRRPAGDRLRRTRHRRLHVGPRSGRRRAHPLLAPDAP